MKKLICFATLFIICLIASNKLYAGDSTFKRKIFVNGSAEIHITPDIIKFNVYVETWNKNKNEARDANRKAVNKVIEVAKKYGVEDKYLSTVYNTITKTYKPKRKKGVEPEVKGYNACYSLEIELRNAQVIDSLKYDMLQAGATSFSSLDLLTSEPRKHYNEARVQAVKAAKEKADEMVAVIGMKVGKAIEITETTNNNSNSYYSNSSIYSNTIIDSGNLNKINFSSKNTIDEDEEEDDENEDLNITQIGKIVLKASVSITFEIE